MLAGRIGQLDQGTAQRATRRRASRSASSATGTSTRSRRTAGSCRPNFTLEYGVRFGNWTNNEELNGLGGYFTPTLYDATQGLVPRSRDVPEGQRRVLRRDRLRARRHPRRTARRSRCRASTSRGTSTAKGNNVVRGGYGMFYNRNMGNVEYDNTLRLRAERLPGRRPISGPAAATATALGLTYDTAHEATLANRIGSIGINSLTPDSFTWPKTHSFSVSYARRIPWNQVVEASYVGTRGRDLVSRSNGNVMPYGALSSGTFNGVDLSVPVNRVAVASVGDNLAVVPAVQRAEHHHALRLPRRVATTTRCR